MKPWLSTAFLVSNRGPPLVSVFAFSSIGKVCRPRRTNSLALIRDTLCDCYRRGWDADVPGIGCLRNSLSSPVLSENSDGISLKGSVTG